MDGLVLAPCDRSAIWLSKALAMLGFLVLAELVALPAFAIFFRGIGWTTVAGVALADIGICAVGSLVSAMAAAARGREVLLPLLFLPLAIPLVIGAVTATLAAVDGDGGTLRPLGFLALYGTFFAVLAWGVFDHLVAE